MSRNAHSGRGFHRWRAALIVVFVIPAVLCASAVKLARASFCNAQAMFCDGVDDDKAAPILCALPEETAKKLSSMKARPNPSGVFCPAISRPRVTPEGAPLLITSSKRASINNVYM